MSKETRTEINSIGEFGLIKQLAEGVHTSNKKTIKGIGDDAAVLDTGGSHYLITSSDMMVEGTHFDLTYVPLHHLGYKLVAINVSDILAMNGTPIQILVNIGLSNRFSVEAIERLYEGINTACKQFGVDLVGGDTCSSKSGLQLSATVIGEVKKEIICYRSGARKNDLLCITGDIGGAYMGLQILEREKQEFTANPEMVPQLGNYEYVVGKLLYPLPRKDVISKLSDLLVVPTAMIDVSDGLASDVLHICEESDVGVVIYEEKIPIEEKTNTVAMELSIPPSTCALHGGEDYELLFTIAQKDFETIKDIPEISIIGHMTSKDAGKIMINSGGDTTPLTAQGWKHF